MKENKEETKLQSEQKDKPLIDEVFADNGEHSHWRLIDPKTGSNLWSEDPEEDAALGYPVIASQFKAQPSPIEGEKPNVTGIRKASEYWRENHLNEGDYSDKKSAYLAGFGNGFDEAASQGFHYQKFKRVPIEGVEREQLREAFEAGQHADEYDQWVKHNYDFDEWLATRKGSISGE